MDVKHEKKKGITMGKAILKLQAFVENGMVTVHILKARHLSSAYSIQPCQSYVEVSLEPDMVNVSRCRTNTRPDRHPIFNEKFSFELVMPQDAKKRLYLSVWNSYQCNQPNNQPNTQPHRSCLAQKPQMQLEFLGCMSFGVHHVLSEDKAIDGWYYLLQEGIGRRKHLQAILNSVIYSDAGEVRQLAGFPGNNEYDHHSNQGHVYSNHEQLYSKHMSYTEPAYLPYEHVTQNCHQIIQDITSGDHQSSNTQCPRSLSPEEDTYTTFVFTKSPIKNEHQNSHNSNGIQRNSRLQQECTQTEQDESDYVKMYPPKSWRQNGYVPNSTGNKPVKQVGFSDLVNAENIRGLPESRRYKDKSVYNSESLVDISEIDTHGYMSLSQVRREEDTIYASIEPLNGSYMNDNVSEISEFTYSKTISKASKSLYPHLNKTPLSSRKLLHLQRVTSQTPGHQNVTSHSSGAQNVTSQTPGHQNVTSQHLTSHSSGAQNVTSHRHAYHGNNKPAVTQKENKVVNQSEILKLQHDKIQTDTTLSPKSDPYWSEYNNIHNDSGIGDHESSPKSDDECSENFAYKPSEEVHKPHLTDIPVIKRQHNLLGAPKVLHDNQSTPKLQRRAVDNINVSRDVPGTPKMQRSVPGTPQVQRHSIQSDQIKGLRNIQVHDSPRWIRDEKSRIICTNDSCVEDNDPSGYTHMAHTPSCPYHVCTNCNGIVPHYRSCAEPNCNHLFVQNHNNSNQPMHKTSVSSRRFVHAHLPHIEETHLRYTEEPDSEGLVSEEDGSSEDDFGYMSMEKFNIYKETVLKHHNDAVKCQDHETTTKIYFL